jgi:tetratricopeptide (TPR) repeat protein
MIRLSHSNDGRVHFAGAAALCASAVALVLAILLGASGCTTVPETIEDNLTPAEFFQRAQEASDVGRYELSQKYYEVFLERFPDETERVLWAKYEIAFLFHKMGKDKLAIEGFDALIAEYEAGPPDLPQGPRILAEKVKARLEEKQEAAAQAEPAPESP